jgi:outer membrane protein TolC
MLQNKLILCLLMIGVLAKGQTRLSLAEAVKFGLENHQTIKNSSVDVMSAEVRIKEIKSAGLPQVNGSLQMMGNPILQKVFLPAKFFNPNAPDDAAPVAAKFGVNFSNNFSLSVNQLVFDGTYLLGLKAADLYRELASKNANASKITVAENVTKAYYSVLVAEERIKILDLNVTRLDTLYNDTKKLNESGFVEKIDVDRFEVSNGNGFK